MQTAALRLSTSGRSRSHGIWRDRAIISGKGIAKAFGYATETMANWTYFLWSQASSRSAPRPPTPIQTTGSATARTTTGHSSCIPA